MSRDEPDRSDLIGALLALSNPHRVRILAALIEGGRRYVSELARQVGLSRPLLYLHLQKLEAAGFVRSELALSSDGKALNWFEACDFNIILSADTIVAAARAITDEGDQA